MVQPKDFIGVGGPNVAGTQAPVAAGATTGSAPGKASGAKSGSVPGSQPGVSGGGTSTGTSAGNPLKGVKAGSCAGFKNGPGITDSQVTIASIADRSGPVADTFKAAHDGMNAFVAYFNSTSSICGRKLKLLTYDSGLTATGSNDASKSACGTAFALVGSFSAVDSGGADVTARCGQPDIRAAAVERARQDAPTTIQVTPLDTDHIFLEPWVWLKQRYGSAIKKSAYVYLNVGASSTTSNAIMKGTEKLGYDWTKKIVVDVAGVPNWNAYANQLKSAGIKFVQTSLSTFTPNLRAAFKQANFNPVFMSEGSTYGPQYVAGANASIMDGAYTYSQTALLEEANRNPELSLMISWLNRTGGDPSNITAAQAWAAGKLFVQVATQLGGKLSRTSLLAALHRVHSFNGGGVLTPSDPGSGTTARCVSVVQAKGGHFVRASPYPYTCGPLA